MQEEEEWYSPLMRKYEFSINDIPNNKLLKKMLISLETHAASKSGLINANAMVLAQPDVKNYLAERKKTKLSQISALTTIPTTTIISTTATKNIHSSSTNSTILTTSDISSFKSTSSKCTSNF